MNGRVQVRYVAKDLYEDLRQKEHAHRKSVAAEVLSLLEENVVTPAELKSRRQFLTAGPTLALATFAQNRPLPGYGRNSTRGSDAVKTLVVDASVAADERLANFLPAHLPVKSLI